MYYNIIVNKKYIERSHKVVRVKVMRYYIVNCKGEVLGENDTRERAEQEMVLMFTQEEIEQDEIEVIEGN